MSRDLVPLALTGRLQVRGGGLLLPGEVAGFPSDVADDLVARGIARRIEPSAADKALDAPPADKMQRSAKKK